MLQFKSEFSQFSGLKIRNGNRVTSYLKNSIMRNQALRKLAHELQDDVVVNVHTRGKGCNFNELSYKLSVTKESRNPIKKFFTKIMNNFGYKRADLSKNYHKDDFIMQEILPNLSCSRLKNKIS